MFGWSEYTRIERSYESKRLFLKDSVVPYDLYDDVIITFIPSMSRLKQWLNCTPEPLQERNTDLKDKTFYLLS